MESFVVESNPNSEKNADLEAKVQEIVPRNALSLTRCRSVPRRSSSLGGRIWESTSESCETVFETENEPKTQQIFRNLDIPILKLVPKVAMNWEIEKMLLKI